MAMDQGVFKTKISRGKECCAARCSNKEYLEDGSKSPIHFFHIPRDVLENRKSKDIWCNLIKRRDGKDNFTMSKSTVICSEHFVKDDIKISIGNKRWSLKVGVRPSLFEWTKVSSCRKPPMERNPLQPICLDQNEQENSDYSYYTDTNHVEYLKESGISTQTESIITCDVETQTTFDQEDNNSENDFHGFEHDYSFNSYTNSSADDKIVTLEHEIKKLENRLGKSSEEISNLKEQILEFENNQFGLDKIKDDPKAVLFYTGFLNIGMFNSVFGYLEEKAEKLQYWRGRSETTDTKTYQIQGEKPGQKRKLSLKDEFFIVMLRLKVGLFVKDISERFNISQGYFSKTFTTWINFLYHELPLLFPFPSRKLIQENLPESFIPFPTTRIIIDCTEVFIEIPSSLTAQSETWSSYKHHNTYKVLVGVSPNGVCTFVSELWGGRVSDKEITKQSGILNLLENGDNIMADRGFDIGDILPEGVTLNIPPFLGNRKQMSSSEVQDTMDIATVRIHVEREMARIKNYHILDGVLPLSLKHISNQMFTVIAYLTNFLPPLVPPSNVDEIA